MLFKISQNIKIKHQANYATHGNLADQQFQYRKIFAMQTQANQILGRTLISWGPNKFEN